MTPQEALQSAMDILENRVKILIGFSTSQEGPEVKDPNRFLSWEFTQIAHDFLSLAQEYDSQEVEQSTD